MIRRCESRFTCRPHVNLFVTVLQAKTYFHAVLIESNLFGSGEKIDVQFR